VAVDPEVTTTDIRRMILMAVAGTGLTCGMPETLWSWIAQGQFVSMM